MKMENIADTMCFGRTKQAIAITERKGILTMDEWTWLKMTL